MIKLFASDLDGTLLNAQQKISNKNIDAIHQLQEAGAEFIINTGREYQNVVEIMEEAGLACGCICTNGSNGYDEHGNQLFQTGLTTDQVKKIFKEFHSFDMLPEIFAEVGRVSILSKEGFFDHLKNHIFPSVLLHQPDYVIDEERIKEMADAATYVDGEDALYNSGLHILKLTGNSVDAAKISQLRKKIEAIPGLATVSTTDTDLEITSVDAQKGIALMKYADMKGIKPDEIVAIGDSENDYSMLSLPGVHSVAMANAAQIAKDVSVYQTRANVDDGVAYIIRCILASRDHFSLI